MSIHNENENKNLGDITKVDENKLEDFNMMTWGFPCTDISIAGHQKGFLDEEGNKTRSGMYYEGIRILRKKKPALSIIENVKNLTGKKFKKEFEMVLSDLDKTGYNSYYKVLNAKDFGVPQNRERVFIVSIRKDLDNGKFKFPEAFDNGIRLRDVLEEEVDEKYYLSDDKVQKFILNLNVGNSNIDESCNDVKQVGNIVNTGNWSNPQVGRIYSPDGCSPTLNTCGGGQREPKIVQIGRINSSQDGVVVSEDGLAPTHTAGHGNTPKVMKIGNANPSGNGMNGNAFSDDGLAPTITTDKGEGNEILQRPRGFNKGGLHDICPTLSSHSWECNNFVSEGNIRIRKLIPLETFRLMGFTDEEFFRAMIGSPDKANEFIEQHPSLNGKTILDEAETIQRISNSQLYKQSGNSIVVDVLYYIYVEIYKAMPNLFDDLRLSSFFSGIGAFESALDRLFESIKTGNFTRPQVE